MEQVLSIQELVDEIMSYNHGDPHVLKSTSLTNKRFYTSSVPHTFHSITFRLGRGISQTDVPGSGTMQSFYDLLQGSPHIGRLVQDLRIVGRLHDVPRAAKEPSDAHMREVLGAFTCISSIDVQHLGLHLNLNVRRYGTWDVLPFPLMNFMSRLFESGNLRSVRFANLHNIPVDHLHLSPNLKSVGIIWSEPFDQSFINEDDATASTVLTTRPQLDSLSYICRSLTSPPIVQLLEPSSPLDLANLKTFNVFVCISEAAQQHALWAFLRPMGPQIEHLGLRAWGDPYGLVPDPLDLGHFKSLRSLHFVCNIASWINHPLAWYTYHFAKLTSPNRIEEITLTFKIRPDVLWGFCDASDDAWRDMDDAIHKAPLPHLRAFNIYFAERDRQGNFIIDDDDFDILKTATLVRMGYAHEKEILNVGRVAKIHPDLAFVDNE